VKKQQNGAVLTGAACVTALNIGWALVPKSNIPPVS
jgi:hypothetical protein